MFHHKQSIKHECNGNSDSKIYLERAILKIYESLYFLVSIIRSQSTINEPLN